MQANQKPFDFHIPGFYLFPRLLRDARDSNSVWCNQAFLRALASLISLAATLPLQTSYGFCEYSNRSLQLLGATLSQAQVGAQSVEVGTALHSVVSQRWTLARLSSPNLSHWVRGLGPGGQ
eukprot:592193-Rhodomonas_salina.1